jgi:hypothetical protein
MLLLNAKQKFVAGAFGYTTKALNGANSDVVHRARRQIMSQFGQPGANQEVMNIAADLVAVGRPKESNSVGVQALQETHADGGSVPTASAHEHIPDKRNEDEYKTNIDNSNEVCITMQQL